SCEHADGNHRNDENDAHDRKCEIVQENAKSEECRGLVKTLRPNCKTSTPGSNPGGASKIIKKTASFLCSWRKQPLPDGLKLPLWRRHGTAQLDDSPDVVRTRV